MSAGVAMQRSCREVWQGRDDRLGESVSVADVFCANQADVLELCALEVELLANFIADATPCGGICQHFCGVDGFLDEREMHGNARRSRLLLTLGLVVGFFSRRYVVWGSGGGLFFCSIGVEPEFQLGGVDRLALRPKDAPAKGVDRLLEKNYLSRLQCDLIEQLLSFGVVH